MYPLPLIGIFWFVTLAEAGPVKALGLANTDGLTPFKLVEEPNPVLLADLVLNKSWPFVPVFFSWMYLC